MSKTKTPQQLLSQGIRQLGMEAALEQFEWELRTMAREVAVIRLRGPIDRKTGQVKTRGARQGFCAHPDCAGQRVVWLHRGMPICARHWRVRRSTFRLMANCFDRKGKAKGSLR